MGGARVLLSLSMLAALLLALVLGMPSASVMKAQEKGGADITGPYDVVPNWPQPIHNDGWSFGGIAAIWAESPDRVLVFMRGEAPALKLTGTPNALALIDAVRAQSREQKRMEHFFMVFDRTGKMVESWDQHNGLFTNPHRIYISPYDPEKHVWLIDTLSQQVWKFSHDGKKIVMTLGEKGVPGNDQTHFNQPSDIVFLPNGDFYVTDGYKNSRVIKFSKEGKFLFQFGKPGTGPGEFNNVTNGGSAAVHNIVIDAKRRLYVAEQANSRIQVFDENGKFIEQWPNIPTPYYLYMSKDQHLWVGDGGSQKILKFDLNGKLLYSWGTFGAQPGNIWGPHQLSVDSEGSFYIANAQGNSFWKLRPKPGADPAKLIGPPFLLSATSGQ